jgi:hypothetical protein
MGLIHSTATATITVATSTTVSAPIYVGAKIPISLQMPAAFTGVAITFQGSQDNVTYQQVLSGGNAYSEVVAAGKNVALDGNVLAAYPYLKLVSGSAEGADRAIVVFTRRPGR